MRGGRKRRCKDTVVTITGGWMGQWTSSLAGSQRDRQTNKQNVYC